MMGVRWECDVLFRKSYENIADTAGKDFLDGVRVTLG